MKAYTLHEAAEILSNSIRDKWGQPMPTERMWTDMKDAFLTGALTFYDEYHQPLDLAKLRRIKDPRATLYAPDYNLLGMYGETTTPEAVNAWLESTGSPHRFPEPEPQPTPEAMAATGAAQPKQRAQESRILELLREKGYDPLNLPSRKLGLSGPKAEIKPLALLETRLFSTKTFDTAWQRLRDDDRIRGG